MSHLDNSYLQHERVIVDINKTLGGRYSSYCHIFNLEPNSRDLVRAGPFGQLSKPCNIDLGHGAKKIQILYEARRVSQHCELNSTTG